jgi:peptidoglycan/xylan/chitin deacetylase (PgdA/CDA1 family)
MRELEMYIDGYIQLPKSVVLTIDDGWRAKIGSSVMAEYEINATIFLMSKHYDAWNYENEYIEVHSHGYDIHNGGLCPGGQGGEIKCMEKSKLLADLNMSRERINNTTYFCYPFYEYNDYSISVLKEAGFTMAFGGYGTGGNYKVKPGINKFKLPRYVIYNYTTENNIATYIN